MVGEEVAWWSKMRCDRHSVLARIARMELLSSLVLLSRSDYESMSTRPGPTSFEVGGK